jgi:uncharacterized damage-inducible protein DinB
MITKPSSPVLSEYMAGYINQAPGNDLLQAFNSTMQQSLELFAKTASKKQYRYAEGKWTIEEMLCHIIDTERIFAYRALTIARGDKALLPGFDQDAYVPYSNANNRSIADLSKEYEIVRQSSIYLFANFTDNVLDNEGTANNIKVTPRIIGWMTAGHNTHHNKILAERYL